MGLLSDVVRSGVFGDHLLAATSGMRQNQLGNFKGRAQGAALLLRNRSAHRGRSGAAATEAAIADEFLDALAGIDFRRIDVAFAV